MTYISLLKFFIGFRRAGKSSLSSRPVADSVQVQDCSPRTQKVLHRLTLGYHRPVSSEDEWVAGRLDIHVGLGHVRLSSAGG